MSTHYFASDGSYGSGPVLTVDTTNWTVTQWGAIDECEDDARVELAFEFASNLAGEQLQFPGM